ncbi:MAG: nucleotide exchange factor GrpE [Bacteroidetes bacterium]|uniref:Protein GrpE n=1 Tax=Candidatus Merdivivens pullicola TaxID=2840872 RepID=A0A9D9NGL4_9BACT|nr:nucleotide exchange factor GrpE [Candidatus Merdivivens pullicola]
MADKEDLKKTEDMDGTAAEAGAGVSGAAKAPESKKKCKSSKKGSAEDALKARVDDLKSQLDKKADEYLRLMAEFDNFRRRTAKERLELVATAGEDVIKGLLPVLDDCERAMAVLRDSDAMAAAKEGTELIYNKLVDYLKSRGLTEIETKDKPLDTDFHEAVAQIPSPDETKKGLIYDVVQKGYMLNGKVIRFAKVVVAI